MSKVSNPSAEVSSESGAMSTPAAKAAYVRDAVEILRVPGGDAKRILKVAKELNKHDEFGYAWRILAKALTLPGIQNEPEYVEIAQRAALATYKDVNLPLEKRLDDALTILTRRAGLTDTDGRITSNDRETLSLAGAIWKRKWEADNRREHLEESFRFYERAYKEEPPKEHADEGYTGVNTDQGYAAINAAYVSDMLGYLESRTDPDSDVVRKRRADARAIRERIVAEVPRLIEPPLSDKKPLGKRESNAKFRKDWFFYGTVGEAHFGLGNYDEAIEWLVTKPEEAGAEPSGWEFETTARQLRQRVRAGDSLVEVSGVPDQEQVGRPRRREQSRRAPRLRGKDRPRAFGRGLPRIALPHRRARAPRRTRRAAPRRGHLMRLWGFNRRRALLPRSAKPSAPQARRRDHTAGLRRDSRARRRALRRGRAAQHTCARGRELRLQPEDGLQARLHAHAPAR